MASATLRGDTYYFRQYAGTDKNGKQIMFYDKWTIEPNMTPAQIKKKVASIKAELEVKRNSDSAYDGNMTFQTYVEKYWVKSIKSDNKHNTNRRYNGLLMRLLPYFGKMKLSHIKPLQVRAFIDELREAKRWDIAYEPTTETVAECSKFPRTKMAKLVGISATTISELRKGKKVRGDTAKKIADYFGKTIDDMFTYEEIYLAPRTILHHYRALCNILNCAIADELIDKNPCDKVKAPKVEYEPAHFLDDQQALELLKLVKNEKHPFDMIIILLLLTGMRRGECCGLDWKDIDFRNCTISIRHSVMYLPEYGVYEDTPKTSSSIRTMKVGKDVIDLLAKYREWQESEAEKYAGQWIDSGKVFTAWNGKPINPGTVTSWFHDFVLRNELPYVSIHGLRHTNASLMIAAGVPITTVAQRLGHSTPATTGNIYAHAFASMDAVAAESLSTMLPLG